MRMFACPICRKYIDAGNRWCYYNLEVGGIVNAGTIVDVDQVLATNTYWSAASDRSLSELLSHIRRFLVDHREHGVVFGMPADDQIFDYDSYEYLEWDDCGPGEPLDISIRTLYMEKNCRSWADVEAYMCARQLPVWWWEQLEIMDAARRRFAATNAERS